MSELAPANSQHPIP